MKKDQKSSEATGKDGLVASLVTLKREPTLEYTEGCAYLRHYSALRFAILTVYFALVGALATAVFGIVTVHSAYCETSRVAAAVAFFMTMVFFTFELGCQRHLEHYKKRLRTLDAELGFCMMAESPKNSGVKFAGKALYGVNLLIWAAVAAFGR